MLQLDYDATGPMDAIMECVELDRNDIKEVNQ